MGCETSTGPVEDDYSSFKCINNTDASPVQFYSIWGYVFIDYNRNGIFDEDDGEIGIGGVRVTLSDTSSTVTNAAGWYIFCCLLPETYIDSVDDVEDMTPTTPQSVEVIIVDHNMRQDFGFVPEGPTYSISGTVFRDDNGDGDQDGGEPGIQYVDVTLNDTLTIQTDENGDYIFAGLSNGDYTVECEDLEGYTLTTPPISRNVTIDNDDVQYVDFGFEPDEEPTYSISGVVFRDNNGDGDQDGGELGIPGVDVTLIGENGGTVASGDDGSYSFVELNPGEYTVVVDDVPDHSPTTPQSVDVEIINHNEEVDFGFVPLYSILGTVFRDDDGDGILDDGEPGIADIRITRCYEYPTDTDPDGDYEYNDLPPGNYCVEVEDIDGMTPTTDTYVYPVEIVDEDVVVNFGFIPEQQGDFTISGTVFFDVNGDGEQGEDEPGIEDIEVTLNDDETTESNADGFYIFEELSSGDYTVECDEIEGLTPTTPISVDVEIVNEDVVVEFGFELDFEDYCGGTADGNTIGFWKNNIKKAILQHKRNGFQIPAATLQDYIEQISEFALAPFSGLTARTAYNILSSRSNDPVDLLAKQLLASEFNFMNESYIDDDPVMTWFFIYYGEYIIVHAGDFTRDEILYAKDWYDAYNNSHGGEFYGPGCDD